MAKHVIEKLIDDLDPETEAIATVYFALDKREYEIDLNDQHIDELHDALAPYIEAGRYADNGRKPAKPAPGNKDKLSREEALAVRTWVRANGGEIGDRGRIPKDVLAAYNSDPKDTSIFRRGDNGQQSAEDARQFETAGSFESQF